MIVILTKKKSQTEVNFVIKKLVTSLISNSMKHKYSFGLGTRRWCPTPTQHFDSYDYTELHHFLKL